MKFLGIVMVLAAGCATPDTVQQFCQKVKDCNYLPAGATESDCEDTFHRCTAQLTSSQQDDWERMIGGCLEDNSCSLFANCWGNVPWC